MAHATLSTSFERLSRAPSQPLKAFSLAGAPTPSPLQFKSIGGKRQAPQSTPEDRLKGINQHKLQKAGWATLDIRQDWADAGWLRGHLAMAGLRVTVSNEPATVARLKTKLRSIGMQSPDVQEAVGMTLAGFLKSNPRLPLWVALAMVLEATGRFTPDAVVTA